MFTSHHTHVALSYSRERELRRATEHAHHAPATRYVAEEAPTVGRLRRRLAQMHLAPAAS